MVARQLGSSTVALFFFAACFPAFCQEGSEAPRPQPERLVRVATPAQAASELQQHLLRSRERLAAIERTRLRLPLPASSLATSSASDFQLVDGALYYYTTSVGAYYMGEIINTGGYTRPFVKVTLTFYDSTDRFLASAYTYVFGSCFTLTSLGIETDTCLRPAETGFFGVYVSLNASLVASVAYSVEYSTSGLATPFALINLVSPVYKSESLGAVKLDGTLRNDGSVPAAFCRVAFALKGGDGGLLDVDFTFADGASIGNSTSGLFPGTTAPFTDYTNASYSLFADDFDYKTAWDDYGSPASPPEADFSWGPANPTAGEVVFFSDRSSNSPTSWQWSFGDGASSSLQSPSHAFASAGSYTVSLTATNVSGSSTASKTVVVGASADAPVAAFTWTPSTPGVGQTVQFQDQSTGSPTAWTWSFGDERSSNQQNPTHVYESVGTFSVVLTVSGAAGSDSILHLVPVSAQPAVSSYWVPVASHVGGLNNSQWRTDIGVLNASASAASVELRFHGSSGTLTKTISLAAGAQMILGDVVGLMGGSGSGAVELRSTGELKVQSRIYNASAGGTFGQGFEGCALRDGLESGESAWLPQLTENAAYRTNIGLVNVGLDTAAATIALYDGSGVLLGSYDVQIGPGVWTLSTQPFATKAGQTNLANGFAKVTVTSGSGVFAFASVTDNITNDPTTIAMQR